MVDLLSTQNRVEVPFVSVTLGGYTFGVYKKFQRGSAPNANTSKTYVNYPNFIKELRIQRNASGTVNVYTIDMVYAVTQFDDPNMLEKIFSKASKDRKVILSYGDYAHPTYAYKEEQALIQKITPSFNFNSSIISYTITAVSSVLNRAAGIYSFPKRQAKPSDIIKEILYSTQYGLSEVFFGMLNKEKVLTAGLIASDDQTVTLDSKEMSLVSYLKYLVDSMRSQSDSRTSTLQSSIYRLSFFDDISGAFQGPYFKVVKQMSNQLGEVGNLITFDLGFPGSSSVIDFRANVSEAWSILYNYNENIQQSQVQYVIDDNGVTVPEYCNTLAQDGNLYKMTVEEQSWLSKMINFPIQATLTIKGLIKPAILCTNIKVNILFYGKSYILSGIYMITGQNDTIGPSGYRTALDLVRVGGAKW